MGQLRDSEIENQKREIARISSQKQQLEGNDREIKIIFFLPVLSRLFAFKSRM